MEMNCHQSDQLLPHCFHNLSWDQPMEQSSQFASAVSSIVSSPSSHTPVSATSSASAVMGELTGRLGSFCNSGEISPRPHEFFGGGNNSGNTSCYTTPMNSPQKLNLSIQGNVPISGNLDLSQLGMEMRPEVASVSAQSIALEESSVSDHTMVGGGSSTRKWKAAQRGRAKDALSTPISRDLPKVEEKENLSAKRTKFSEATGSGKGDVKEEPSFGTNSSDGDQKPKKESNPKRPEPPKQDYIHVRARRGQATDSHSLAERVRREKISERMKFLQGLVPGCNKVTGKAVVLDEIINYVQSLQRQVEFLSMKLAAVNPWVDFNMEYLLHNNMHHSPRSSPSSGFPSEITTAAFPFAPQPLHSTSHQNIVTGNLENSLESTVRKSTGVQSSSFDGFDDFSSQGGVFWDDDLQNVVQMGFGQNRVSVSSPTFHVQFGI